ncbi:MAG: hypothetical protein BWZ10_02542 [candidate division BRC1 bacterium ADurb.BinA364]|nr:MAG: hypothetical protein BWZ10_02542 [candidate division BRC1 bacterium ADurb.BinA364]
MRPEIIAMIGVQHDNRVVLLAGLLQRRQHFANDIVHERAPGLVMGDGLADLVLVQLAPEFVLPAINGGLVIQRIEVIRRQFHLVCGKTFGIADRRRIWIVHGAPAAINAPGRVSLAERLDLFDGVLPELVFAGLFRVPGVGARQQRVGPTVALGDDGIDQPFVSLDPGRGLFGGARFEGASPGHMQGIDIAKALPALGLRPFLGVDVPFAGQAQFIAQLLERSAPVLDPIADAGVNRGRIDAVVVDAMQARIDAGEKSGARRAAVAGHGVHRFEPRAFVGDGLHVRQIDGAVGANRAVVAMFEHENEDVRFAHTK